VIGDLPSDGHAQSVWRQSILALCSLPLLTKDKSSNLQWDEMRLEVAVWGLFVHPNLDVVSLVLGICRRAAPIPLRLCELGTEHAC